MNQIKIELPKYKIKWREKYLRGIVDFGKIAIEVTTLHIPPGSSNGWEKIITHNNDLPIKMEKTDPVFNKLFEKGHNPGFNCDFILDPMFRLYSMCLKEFIVRSPDWVNTINATEGGSLFCKRIKNMRFVDFLNAYKN